MITHTILALKLCRKVRVHIIHMKSSFHKLTFRSVIVKTSHVACIPRRPRHALWWSHLHMFCFIDYAMLALFLIVTKFENTITIEDDKQICNTVKLRIKYAIEYNTHPTLDFCHSVKICRPMYTVFRKKHPLTFSLISPWIVCGFKQKIAVAETKLQQRATTTVAPAAEFKSIVADGDRQIHLCLVLV